MAADAILDFQKFKILTVDPLQWANMRHHAKFHQNWSNGCRYGDLTVFFQDGGRPPSWICWAPIGTTHDDHLVVSIIVPNLVKIDAVVSITYQLSIFGPFGLKTLRRLLDGHAGSAIKVLVAIHYSVLDARNGYIRNVVV